MGRIYSENLKNWEVAPTPGALGATEVIHDANFDTFTNDILFVTSTGKLGRIQSSYYSIIYNTGVATALHAVVANATDALIVVAGAGGVIRTSGDPTNTNVGAWTARTSGTTNTIRGLGTDGTNFVYVADGGVIRSSPDAATWTARTSGTTNALNGVAYGKGGSTSNIGDLWVAVGANGTILTSPDFTTWTARTSGTTQTLNRVFFAPVSGNFVAVGNAGIILTSDNGVNWALRSSGTANNLRAGVAYRNKFAIVGDAGTVLSSDGDVTTWTLNTGNVPSNVNLTAISEDQAGNFQGWPRFWTWGNGPSSVSVFTRPIENEVTKALVFVSPNGNNPSFSWSKFYGEPVSGITLYERDYYSQIPSNFLREREYRRPFDLTDMFLAKNAHYIRTCIQGNGYNSIQRSTIAQSSGGFVEFDGNTDNYIRCDYRAFNQAIWSTASTALDTRNNYYGFTINTNTPQSPNNVGGIPSVILRNMHPTKTLSLTPKITYNNPASTVHYIKLLANGIPIANTEDFDIDYNGPAVAATTRTLGYFSVEIPPLSFVSVTVLGSVGTGAGTSMFIDYLDFLYNGFI